MNWARTSPSFAMTRSRLKRFARWRQTKSSYRPDPAIRKDAGVSLDLIRELGAEIPLLGVCLGHQAIGEAYGGVVTHAPELMHGKTSMIYHEGDTILADIPNPFEATRYHSLIVEEATLPDCFVITARTASGEIMGLRHKTHPVIGVQFHPESILTRHGLQMLGNFMKYKPTAVAAL